MYIPLGVVLCRCCVVCMLCCVGVVYGACCVCMLCVDVLCGCCVWWMFHVGVVCTYMCILCVDVVVCNDSIDASACGSAICSCKNSFDYRSDDQDE